MVGKATGTYPGRCYLFNASPNVVENNSYDLYEKFDATEMSSCMMAYHILETDSPDKFSCENVLTCERIKADVSEAGLL